MLLAVAEMENQAILHTDRKQVPMAAGYRDLAILDHVTFPIGEWGASCAVGMRVLGVAVAILVQEDTWRRVRWYRINQSESAWGTDFRSAFAISGAAFEDLPRKIL